MPRKTVEKEEDALIEIGVERTQPPWMEGAVCLPFSGLTPDEFEVLCFLLLKREQGTDRVFYYGKTGDGGRDVVVRLADNGVRYIQCKHYSGTVGIGDVRAELAKLFCNVHSGTIPDQPERLDFYVTTDLSAPAQDLLDNRDKWLEVAEAALEEHLGKKPAAALIQLAKSWWPEFGRSSGHELSDRIRKHQDLVDQFFSFKKVIEGSIDDVKPILRSLGEQIAQLQVSADASRENAPAETAELLRRMEAANQGLAFSVNVNAAGTTVFSVSPRAGASVEVGQLKFPTGPKGDAGKEKLLELIDYGRQVRFEEGEFEWVSALKALPHLQGEKLFHVLELRPQIPRQPIAVEISCGEGTDSEIVIRYTRGRLLRIGRKEMELSFQGGELAGSVNLVLGFSGAPNRITYNQDLSSGPARAARATLDLLAAISEQRFITIRSIDFASPLVGFMPGPELAAEKQRLQNSLGIARMLERLAAKFNADLRYPEGDVEPGWVREVELAFAAIEAGRVSEPVPGNVLTMPMPKGEAERLLDLWEQNCPATIEGANSLPVQVSGTVLPLGERRLVLENAEPVGGLDEFRSLVSATTEPTLTATLAVSRLIHEFPQYVRPDEAGPNKD
jgi:hypothetical protein